MAVLPSKNTLLITVSLIALLFFPVAFMVAYQDKSPTAGVPALAELEEKGKIFRAEISKTPPPSDLEWLTMRIRFLHLRKR
jgi:hypothetical protein